MAKLILKSPYVKSTGGASGYLKYIATRERVEIIPDDRPPTRKQEQLINKLTKDFPDSKTLYEYEDYMDKPTKANASAFITLALESNWDSVVQSDQYMKYIATRPRAERLGEHGLFGDEDGVSLDTAMTEMHWLYCASAQGNVYAEALIQQQNSCRPPNVFLGVTRLLHHMGRIFQEQSLPQSNPGGIQIDRKRLEQLQEKREAHGLNGNVFEEYKGPTMSM